MERGLRASQELYEYFCGIIGERRQSPSDDVISVLVKAESAFVTPGTRRTSSPMRRYASTTCAPSA